MSEKSAPLGRIRGMAAAVICVVLASWPVLANEVDTLKKQGDILYETHSEDPGKFPLAIMMYEQAIEKAPNDYDALWKVSRMCQVYGQTLPEDQRKRKISVWKKGQDYGKRAVEVNPDGKEGHFYYMSNLGAVVQAKGKLSGLWNVRKIKKAIDKTLEIDPDFPPALVARARYLTQMPGLFGGDRKEALALYERAVEVDPGYYVAYYYLAEMKAEDRQYDEAVANLNKILHCPEQDRTGSWATIDRVWAENLLEEIREEQAR